MIGRVLSGGGQHDYSFYDVINIENLLQAWKEFRKGKRGKDDVAKFELDLEGNLFSLHQQLKSYQWKPDPYEMFLVNDPKQRKIHKATVRDRVLYQAVHRILYQVFDPSFIFYSYSSRDRKGTHAGVDALEKYIRQTSKNYRQRGWVVKCDIRKFFDSIDHHILFGLIQKKIKDADLLALIRMIIDSFSTVTGKGLPLGNVTSQLFANIYMSELDQYIKRSLKAKCYVRYCDDFAIGSSTKEYAESCVEKIAKFCRDMLLLDLHPRKIILRTIRQGVDFLGYVSLPHYRVLRPRTKRRMMKKLGKMKSDHQAGLIDDESLHRSKQSYLGVLSHCKGETIKRQIEEMFGEKHEGQGSGNEC
jgi:RNA-directed DNA polymerase